VISDSFNNLGGYALDVATGALPADVVVLKEHPVMVEAGLPQPGSDDGRAMAQLVHSIAAGASLFFATVGNAPEVFADSIEQLVAAGCEIIVDDITEGGSEWIDVSRPPASGSPSAADGRPRQPHDSALRPASLGAAIGLAFSIIGWNGITMGSSVSDISFEATSG
jgi:hypothetical protein